MQGDQVEEQDCADATAQRLKEVSGHHRTSLLSRLWWNLRAHITADQPTRRVCSYQLPAAKVVVVTHIV